MNSRLFWMLAMTVLILGYQNCSNGMSFEGTQAAQTAKVDTVTTGGGLTNEPDVEDVADNDPDRTPGACEDADDNDDDDRVDYDHEGRKIVFNCATGARRGWDTKDFKNARDLTIENKRGGFISRRPVRNVIIRNTQGSVAIVRNSLHVLDFVNAKNLVSAVRSVDIDRVSGIESGITAAAAVTLDELSNVKSGFVCASGQEIGSISNVQSLFVKVRGRRDGGKAGTAREISNIKAGFISLSKLDVSKISGIQGELIIRNAVIGEISGLKGGLTLINSTVGTLKDSEGVLRMKNSSVGAQSNVNMTSAMVKAKD